MLNEVLFMITPLLLSEKAYKCLVIVSSKKNRTKQSKDLKAMLRLLKELQNLVLGIILVWSLFFLIRVYGGLHFLQFFWKTRFSSFCTVCAFC